ncbi:MAG: DUF1653 domain-containing protein [Cellvibrionaceae bacterium]
MNDHPNDSAVSLKTGRYRHYKGGEYDVISVATHSETGETLVVYRCLYDEGSWWVRPLDMFTESVTVDGKKFPRFTLLHEVDKP